MEALLVSLSTVALAEMGDRTQLLCLLLVTRFRQPWAILTAVLCATLASHALAGIIGVLIGRRLSPTLLDAVVGVSMIGMAVWMLKPDRLTQGERVPTRRGVFVTTLVAFFIAEIGDKTQIATLALAAGYHNLVAVVAGTTCGMLLANAPVIFIGHLFAEKLPIRAIHYSTCALMIVIGVVFLVRAAHP